MIQPIKSPESTLQTQVAAYLMGKRTTKPDENMLEYMPQAVKRRFVKATYKREAIYLTFH